MEVLTTQQKPRHCRLPWLGGQLITNTPRLPPNKRSRIVFKVAPTAKYLGSPKIPKPRQRVTPKSRVPRIAAIHKNKEPNGSPLVLMANQTSHPPNKAKCSTDHLGSPKPMPKGSSAEDHLFPMLATSTLEIRQKVLGAPRWQPGRPRDRSGRRGP